MRALLSVLLLAASSYAAPATDTLLPPDATVVFGLRAANLLKVLRDQGAMQLMTFQAGALMGAMPVKGFDPFRDIDDVVLATTGKGNNPPFLAIVTGRFDPAKMAAGKGQPYHNALLIDDKNPRQTTAFLGETTLLAGDRALVRAAIDRASGSTVAGPLAARIESMRARYDLWAFADHFDLADMPAAANPAANPAADMLRSLDSFWMGMGFKSDFTLDGELHLRSADDAAKLSGLLSIWEKQALHQMPNAPQMNFNLGVEGSTIKVALSIPEAELKKAAERAHSGTQMSAAPASGGLRITGGDPQPKEQEQKVTTDAQGNTVNLSLPYRKK